MDETFIVRNSTVSDVPQILKLDAEVYPEEWQVSAEVLENVIRTTPEPPKVVEYQGEIKGIFGMAPLTKEGFAKLLNGEIGEKEMADFVAPYVKGSSIHLYLATFVVQKSHPLRRKFAKALIEEIKCTIAQIRKEGMNIQEIGALAISEDGVRVLDKSGLSNVGPYFHDETVFVFRGKDF